ARYAPGLEIGSAGWLMSPPPSVRDRSSVESWLEACSEQVRTVGLGDPTYPPFPVPPDIGDQVRGRFSSAGVIELNEARNSAGCARPAGGEDRLVEPVG